MSATAVYHPDPEINEGVAADALAGEQADLAAGYPPRPWACGCGARHSRGHFQSIGVHRCLRCGYVGPGGVMLDPVDPASQEPKPTPYPVSREQIEAEINSEETPNGD